IISLGGKPPVETTAADENSPAPLLALTVDCATDEGKLVKSLLDALNSRDASVSEKCKNALAGKPSHEISEKLLLIQAYGHFSAEKFDEAITQAKDFLAKNKTSSFTDKMLLLIGDSYAAKKQTDACRAVYKKIIDKSPDSEEGKSAAQKMKELV
ncbi:MAG TPA: hypothetical protein DC049_02860, partial [Spirochaetia bacterium]|nr:hypothetical protein [Spirochaetia bacterium]